MSRKHGFCDLGFTKLDIARHRRRGFSEVVYAPGKTKSQLKQIVRQILEHKQQVLITKLEKAVFQYLKKSFPKLKYNSKARLAYLLPERKILKQGIVAVVSAGTADIPVAEEAAVTLEVMGNRTKRLYDVGVAGIHRLVHNIEILKKASVVIVVAGMEGALASVVSGLVNSPVIAVPTSVGYGSSFKGLSSLLTMLNSCSCGISVVNIDNGFGAGYFASLINK